MKPTNKKARWATAVPSREEQHALKRQALIREAGRAFSRKGFHNTSMDDVAKVLNVTKPALYYYIKNKQDILYECHSYALDIAEQARRAAFEETEDPLERIRLLFVNYIELLTSKFGSYAVLAEPISSLEPEYREKIRLRMREFDSMCRNLVEAAIENGTITPCDPRLAIAFFMGAVNNITRWYSPTGPRSGKEIAQAFTSFIMDGLRAGPHRLMPMQPPTAQTQEGGGKTRRDDAGAESQARTAKRLAEVSQTSGK